jgi:6-phosphogluconolactonase
VARNAVGEFVADQSTLWRASNYHATVMHNPEIKVLPSAAAIAQEAASRIEQCAEAAIELNGRFSLGLSGGSTPRMLYQLLADNYRGAINWTKVEVFFGDERCVGPEDKESNYRMAREALLSKVPIPGDNVYRMRGEIDPQDAAKEYGSMLKERFGDAGLDLILLGLGDDGHTASLFPHTQALTETKHRCVANYAEHSTTGKSWRITLTAPFINRCNQALFLVVGAAKADALAHVLEGETDPQRWPAQLIKPHSGKLTWLVDAAAAGM